MISQTLIAQLRELNDQLNQYRHEYYNLKSECPHSERPGV